MTSCAMVAKKQDDMGSQTEFEQGQMWHINPDIAC